MFLSSESESGESLIVGLNLKTVTVQVTVQLEGARACIIRLHMVDAYSS